MQKNNVTSFVCSFIFSILAVVAVQKVFLYTPQTVKNPKTEEIPSKIKPISLFSEPQEPVSQKVSAKAPVTTTNISAIESLVSMPKPSEQVAEQIRQEKPVQTVQEQNLISTDLSEATEIILAPVPQEIQTAETKHEETGIVYADISDTFETSKPSLEVASTEPDVIPLAIDNQILHQNIEVSNTAGSAQIAMLEPQTLVSSLEDVDLDSKSFDEADLKKNELASSEPLQDNPWVEASAAQDPQESPWVVARGNRFAKNRVIVEQYAETEQVPEPKKDAPAPDEPQVEPEEEPAPEVQIQEESQEEIVPVAAEPQVESQIEPEPAAPVDDQILKTTLSGSFLKKPEQETRLAYQMIQNILIPIPEDILNDADLTPQLTSSPEEKERAPKEPSKPQNKSLNETEKQSGLFQSITSWFGKKDKTGNKKQQEQGAPLENNIAEQNPSFAQKIYSGLGKIEDYQQRGDATIMPAELRLSFQPNRAEISGQTLRWIYAFADNARDNDDTYIEVRIDGTSTFALQQKRLNLLSNIFANRGVDFRKINTIFTSREPNSFIIRNIRFNNDEKGLKEKSGINSDYHRW